MRMHGNESEDGVLSTYKTVSKLAGIDPTAEMPAI